MQVLIFMAVYLTCEVLAGLAIYALYRRSERVRAIVRAALAQISGLNEARRETWRLEDRLAREIRNRRILKDRVARAMEPTITIRSPLSLNKG